MTFLFYIGGLTYKCVANYVDFCVDFWLVRFDGCKQQCKWQMLGTISWQLWVKRWDGQVLTNINY